MRTFRVTALAAVLLCAGCGRSGPPKGVKRAELKPVDGLPARIVPFSETRAAVRERYRLRPDRRFLLAFGEVARLAAGTPAPPGLPATATFSGNAWTVRVAERDLGTLPELPDFPDYFPLLVAQARASMPRTPAGRTPKPDANFLMPGLRDSLLRAEDAFGHEEVSPALARAFARLAFQMSDRLEVAPLVFARALALLAVVRSRDPRAGLEEEVLLAHALGYTAHAERAARSLPAGSPVRLFATLDDDVLSRAASAPGSSEEVRYYALRRSTAHGSVRRWREAQGRYFPGDESSSVVATGLDLELPAQLEVESLSAHIREALPRAVLRELAVCSSNQRDAAPWETSEYDAKITAAASAAAGHVWDGAVLSAYYEAAFYSPLEAGRWPGWAKSGLAAKLTKISRSKEPIPGEPGDTTAAPLIVEKVRGTVRTLQGDQRRLVAAVRAVVPHLDARPIHRSDLAWFLHYQLADVRAAEDLQRSVARDCGDASRRLRAEAALYLGDWDTVERLLKQPQAAAPEIANVLWRWYGARTDFDRLDAAFVAAGARFPHDWNLTNYYVDFLRDRKRYRDACTVVETWLTANRDPRTPGYFHAHVRLAHGYVLANEPARGLALVDAMPPLEGFQKTIVKRQRGECLAALGKTAEGEILLREAIREAPGDPDDLRHLARVLWQSGKDKDAAALVADPKSGFSQSDTCKALWEDFPAVFLDAPPARADAAVAALAAEPRLGNYYNCVAYGFKGVKRYEDAIRLTAPFENKAPEKLDFLVMTYRLMRETRGKTAAAAWVKAHMPPGQLNPFSMKAMYTKTDELLWDVIETPDPKNHPEWVWLFRATAYTLRGGDADPHKADLLAYYGKESAEPYHVMGRYLLGLASEAQMFALATTRERVSEVAYYLGAKAEHEKRFRDACEWYRVSIESGEKSSESALSIYTLGAWSRSGQGIWRVEAGKPYEE